MIDIVYILLILLIFGLCGLFVDACERI